MATTIIDSVFANPTLRRVLFKSRFLLALVLLIPLAWHMNPALLPVGFAVSMLGQVIQSWCFASLVKNTELTVRGPYLVCRNPMYLGRFFMMLGFVLLLGHWIPVVAFTVLYYLYMSNRVKREERRLQRVFGEAFTRYCSNVRRFFPSLGAIGNKKLWFFDWSIFRSNNAHWNIVGTLIAYGLLFGIREALERFA